MADVVSWLLDKKEIEVYAFFEEIPIKVKLKLVDVDFDKQQIIWTYDKRLELPLTKSRELYFEYNGTVYTLVAIIHDDKELVTTFPTVSLEPKLKRRHIRVRTTEEHPVKVIIDDKVYSAIDISERGVGILTRDIEGLEIGKTYNLLLNIEGEELPAKGEIVYIKEADKGLYRVGIRFEQLPMKVEDKIFKYIMARQKEVAKKIAMFKE